MLELIHIDVWGPYHTSTYDGFRYFLTIVDGFSRTTWIKLLSMKSNAFLEIKHFIAMVERQFDRKIKCIRSDNAYELGSSKEGAAYLLSMGIMHQTSCVATPHNKMEL